MNKLLMPKVSIVMQSYLQNYPGSRENSVLKFKRAVESFKNQVYKNSELIIVADNCELTMNVFKDNYSNDNNIKFIFYHRNKNDKKMYEKDNQGKVFRGFARQVGRTLVEGELTTYMDSDDVLSPKFTYTITLEYNRNPNLDWMINKSWYDNYKSNWPDNRIMYSTIGSPEIELDYIDSKWNQIKLKEPYFVMTPWLLTHRSECNTKWRDTYGDLSEDTDFSKRLRSEYKNGHLYTNPTYVRCHYSGVWDI